MADSFRNYTEVGILFPNRESEGHSGPATVAAPLIITPGAQLVLSDHPRIDKSKGALQISILRETKKR
jgi:hypothetical protein